MPACERTELSMPALHLRCVALGGVASLGDLVAHCTSGEPLSAVDHDIAVHAVNERFLERNDPERLPYAPAGGAE